MNSLLVKSVRATLLAPRTGLLALSSVNANRLTHFSMNQRHDQHKRRWGDPRYFSERYASSKGDPRDRFIAIAISVGIIGSVLALNGFVTYKSNKYADSSNQPVYEKRPKKVSPSSKQDSGERPEADEESEVPTTASPISPPSTAEALTAPANVTKTTVRVPPFVKHVIVGAGATGISAARAIRAADPLSTVLLVAGDETCGEDAIPIPGEDGKTQSMTYPPPYIRPVLSGGMWWRSPERRQAMLNPTGDIRKHSWFFYEPLSFFIPPEKFDELTAGGTEGGVCLLRGNPVVAVEPEAHRVRLADGQTVEYGCCLLATGVRPRPVPAELARCSLSGADLVAHKRVTTFRNIADYKHLQGISDRLHKSGGRVAVIGYDQLSCELATSLLEERRLTEAEKATAQKDSAAFHVHHFLGYGIAHPMEHVLPPALAESLSNYETQRGILLAPSAIPVRVSLVDPSNPAESPIRLTIHKRLQGGVLKEEEDLVVDHVVCALGTEPRTELAAEAGLEIDPVGGGFLVNSELESRADIYVAGSAASFWDPTLNCRRRIDHISVSEDTGELAGLNMARSAFKPGPEESEKLAEAYFDSDNNYDPLPAVRKHQSSLWFNLGKGAQFDCVGMIDSQQLVTRTFFLEGAAKSPAVVFYLHPEDSRLLGVMLWNLPDELFEDDEYAVPSRLNLARHLINEKTTLATESDLLQCARKFDLGGEIAQHYKELKAFIEAKKAQEEAEAMEKALAASADQAPRDAKASAEGGEAAAAVVSSSSSDDVKNKTVETA